MNNDQTNIEHGSLANSLTHNGAEIDSDLTDKAYEALHGDSLISNENISVRVLNRTAYLEGTVSSENERDMAYEDVVNIFGVRNVVNYLTFPCPYLSKS